MDFMLLGGVFLLGAAAGVWFAGVIDQLHKGLNEQHAVAESEGE